MLPEDIVQRIRTYSECPLFWRVVAAFHATTQLRGYKKNATAELSTVKMSSIVRWVRGGTGSATFPRAECFPFIYIIVDVRGIKSIERLPAELPLPPVQRYKNEAYILENECQFEDVTVFFQVRFAPLTSLVNSIIDEVQI